MVGYTPPIFLVLHRFLNLIFGGLKRIRMKNEESLIMFSRDGRYTDVDVSVTQKEAENI